MDKIDGFLSVSDAGKRLGWKASEVYMLITKKLVESVKIGNTYLIVEDSLNKFQEGLG